MTHPNLDNILLKPSEREELEHLFTHTQKMREDMKRDPEVARQFLKDIGLLDADGNRVALEGEEHLTSTPTTRMGRAAPVYEAHVSPGLSEHRVRVGLA